MQADQRSSRWSRTPKRAILLLGLLLGGGIGFALYPVVSNTQAIHPLYGVMGDHSNPYNICVTADYPVPESISPDKRILCFRHPFDSETGRALELPPAGSRVEVGMTRIPIDSWNSDRLMVLYVIPEQTLQDRLSWLWVRPCYPCFADTPEQAARLRVSSTHYGALTRAEVQQSFQVQDTQPIPQGVVVFYQRADYRASVRKIQRACAQLIRSDGRSWSSPENGEYCTSDWQTGSARWSIQPELADRTVFWGVFGEVSDPQVQHVEIVSYDDGIPVRSAIHKGYVFLMVPGETAPVHARLLDGDNHVLAECDLYSKMSCNDKGRAE